MKINNDRLEYDALGKVRVSKTALYGAQSVRAVKNFNITNQKINPIMIWSLGAVKKACAQANKEMGDLESDIGNAIISACEEIMEGDHNHEFITDPIQGGAGTSINMNINEVIANRASQIIGEPIGTYLRVHPNDHVNKAQSTNDIIPTSGKLTTIILMGTSLVKELGYTQVSELTKKALREDRTLRELVLENHLLSESLLNEKWDPQSMIRPR